MQTSINDISPEQAYYMSSQNFSRMVGSQFRVDHLKSQKGKILNGKTCQVVGFTNNYHSNPDCRLQCKVQNNEDGTTTPTTEGRSKPILLKGVNLVAIEANVMRTLMSASDPLPDSEIMKGLRQGLAEHMSDGTDAREDLQHRVSIYKTILAKLEARNEGSDGNALADADYCFPCGAVPPINEGEVENVFDMFMRLNRPACVGNNQVDLRFMDLGLKGDGLATCSICKMALEKSETKFVTLPCVHQFHTSCLRQWLSSDLGRRNWSCPTCRHIVPFNMQTYMIRYEAELKNRFKEVPLTGFCPKCILWVMERDRNQEIPGTNQDGEPMTIGSVGQMNEKIYMQMPSGK